MRSPVSSRLLPVSVEQVLEGLVLGGVVGDAVLPAVPDDEEPGAGEDADGVGVVVASGAGSVVEVGGPGVGVSGVGGEVGDGVAELFVAGPAEADGAELAGLAGRWCGAGEAGECFGGGEAGAAVTDLGEQAGGADGSGAGQAGEDVLVCVRGELVGDLGGQGAPSCGAETRPPVRSLIGARRRSALSTVGTSRVTAGPRRSHAGRPTRQASRAMTQRHLGCIGNPSTITDQRMVHQ